MSIYDKATLVQIPSGHKASSAKLYSVLPANGDGDFTVSADADATRVNSDGFIETTVANQARLSRNFIDGVVQPDPFLLLEPTRTNLVFPNNSLTGYSTVGVTTSNNQITAPNGTNEGAKVQTTTSGGAVVFKGFTGTSGVTHNISAFVKAGTHNQVQLQEGFAGANMVVNLTNGNIISNLNSSNLKVEKYPNGWYRLSFDFTSASTNLQFSIYFSGSYSSDDNYFMWGGQIEQGSGVTSLIPTSGSVVTRTQDTCINGGNNALFNDSEGVLFADLEALADGTTTRKISLSNGSTDFINIQFTTNSGEIAFDFGSTNNNFTSVSVIGQTPTSRNKIAIKYKSGDVDCYINGTRVTGSSLTFTLSGLDRVNFDWRAGTGIQNMFAKIYQVMIFNTALTDSELIQLTSYDSFGQMAKALLYTIE